MILSRHPQSQVLVALVDRRQAVVAAALLVTFSHIFHLSTACRNDVVVVVDDDDDDDHDDDDDDADGGAGGGGGGDGDCDDDHGCQSETSDDNKNIVITKL